MAQPPSRTLSICNSLATTDVLSIMVFSSALLGLAAAATCFLVTSSISENKPLPWDGTGKDLAVTTLSKKFLTHILTMRNGSSNGNPENYVTIDPEGRSPAYNGDNSVINIGVDAKARFQNQTNLRRSELVQKVVANTKGTTFFRTSVMKKTPFLNKFAWQIIFPEVKTFEIRVDATKSPPMLIYLNNGTWDAKYETEFVFGTWYNIGIAVKAATTGTGSVLDFYMSEGNEDLELKVTHEVVSEFPKDYEFHFGPLVYFETETPPTMADNQDILSYNGVMILDEVETSGSEKGVQTSGSGKGEQTSGSGKGSTYGPMVGGESDPVIKPAKCARK
ncbi:hypothetical protein CCR75_002879 [Bremia lactucae]|uniref:Glycoside hydrolase 131 catalytic N-terminal domain-containing protein n=1 Tax=Bremia lactucae TaxID=4779 RepID=A0A976FMT2_BRELC|nr:hypothetical protein CCR75_002879 [Bremia lactucae]